MAAADAPRSHIASPDVYQVIAQDNDTRIIMATWKPGQRDAWHSHPGDSWVARSRRRASPRRYRPEG